MIWSSQPRSEIYICNCTSDGLGSASILVCSRGPHPLKSPVTPRIKSKACGISEKASLDLKLRQLFHRLFIPKGCRSSNRLRMRKEAPQVAVELSTIKVSNSSHTTWVCSVRYILGHSLEIFFFSVGSEFVESTEEIKQSVMIDQDGILGSLKGPASILELTPG